ncbi:MAG: hypothetical protein H6744_06780 [Deltaproteobacteria bacterium]|nr:hypothetical protein [Deltaproteobacteria bacterium]MCB9786384.1 hypothetical protein [Deltaproteobacteria bacterium]
MAFEIVDVGHELSESSASPGDGTPTLLVRGPAAAWSLLRLEPGQGHDDSDAACVERSFLILDGFGTALTPERRATVSAGMLVLVSAGVAFDLRNDGAGPLVVLVATRPRILASKESS